MKLNGKEKETADTGLKRSRSSSLAAATGPQRVPLGPGRVGDVPVQTNNSRPTSRALKPTQLPSRPSHPLSQHNAPPIVIAPEEDDVEQLEKELKAAGADTAAFEYVRRTREITRMSAGGAFGGSATPVVGSQQAGELFRGFSALSNRVGSFRYFESWGHNFANTLQNF